MTRPGPISSKSHVQSGREAVEVVRIGVSTSRGPQHQGAVGWPVPSRFADVDEVFALASVLGEVVGVVQAAVGPGVFIEQLSELVVANSRPVTWTASWPGPSDPVPPSGPSHVPWPSPARCTRRSRAGRS